MKKIISNPVGMTIIQVLFAMGIISIIGLGMTNLIVSVMSNQAKLERRSEASTGIELLKIVLAKSDICKANLNSLIVNVDNPEATQDFSIEKFNGLNSDGSLSTAPLFSIVNNEAGIKSVSVGNFRRLCPVSREFIAEIEIDYRVGAQQNLQRFFLFITTDNAGKITNCSTVAKNVPDALCI